MRRQRFAALSILLLGLWGCGSPGFRSPDSSPLSIRISPASAVMGSADLTLTITGKNFGGTSVALWSANGGNTYLATTFVSSTQLSALVPAALLANALTAQVFVETWERQGESPVPRLLSRTKDAVFSITTVPVEAPAISLISPASASAGSSDVQISISGSNFENTNFRHTSVAFWTTNPGNLHDFGIMLRTTFISTGELSAVIPAALLQTPTSVQIVVLNGDVMGMSDGYFGYPRSNAVTFEVTP